MAAKRSRTYKTGCQTFSPQLECLEDRTLLSFLTDLAERLRSLQTEDGLVRIGNEKAKPILYAKFDVANPTTLAALGGILGSWLPVVGTGLGAFIGARVGQFTHATVQLGIDLQDIFGRGAAETQDFREGYITIWAEFSTGSEGIGLPLTPPIGPFAGWARSLIERFGSLAESGFDLGLLFARAESKDCDPQTLRQILVVGTGGIHASGGSFQFNLEPLGTSFLIPSLSPDVQRTSTYSVEIPTLANLLAGKGWRSTTSSCQPRPFTAPLRSIRASVPGYLDSSRHTESFEVFVDRTENLQFEFLGLNRGQTPLGELIDPDGRLSVGTNGKVTKRNARPGRYVLRTHWRSDEPQPYVVVRTHPLHIDPDPVESLPPSRVFGDSAGHDFDRAKFVALDRSNRGDDSGRISPRDDIDFYRFVTNSSGTIEIDVVPQSGLTTFVTLYDGSRNAIGTDSPSDDGTSHFRRNVSANQTYYVKVESQGRTSTGLFELRVRPFDPARAPGGSGTDGPPGPLPGWGGVRGVQIRVNGGSGSSRGSIDDPGEVDWYQIDRALPGRMQIEVAGTNDDLTEFLTIFRADGSPVDTDSGLDDGIARSCFTVNAGERMIAAVTSHEGRSRGPYEIRINQPPSCPRDDHPNFGQTPRRLDGELTDEGNGFIRGRIEEPNDNDWFAIHVRGAGYLTIQVDQSNSSLVGFLELSRTPNGSGWFESDDGRDGEARVSFIPVGLSTVYAKVSSRDGTRGAYTLNVWRGPDPNDDYPDGDYRGHRTAGRAVPDRFLGPSGTLTLRGRIQHPGDTDGFRVRGSGQRPIAIEVVSLTEGFTPFLWAHWWVCGTVCNSDGGSGRGARTHMTITNILEPNNWVNILIGGRGSQPFGDYVLHVWEPRIAQDLDPDRVGIEASPVLLNGAGRGSLPGFPNGPTPAAIDFAGDVDVCQMDAVAARPLTFTVASGFGTFLRVYDATGRAIASDQNSGPGGASRVTVEAERGQRFYLEVSAFNGSSVGNYTITVDQPADDHPDAAIFEPRREQRRDATPIQFDGMGRGSRSGRIDPVGDRDVFQFQARGHGQVTVDGVTTDNQLDVFLRVFDSRGGLVAADDDGGDGRNSRVTFSTFMGETYFLEISGYGDASVGNYTVTVQEVGPSAVELIGTYDDFARGFDTSKWSLRFDGARGRADIRASGGTLQLRADGRGAPNDATATTLDMRASVTNSVEFDVLGDFGGSHNWGRVELTDGVNSITLNFQKPDGACGDTSGRGVNLNFCIFANGYRWPTSTPYIAPFTENVWHRFAIREDGAGNIRILQNGRELARLEGQRILPGSFLRAQTFAASAPDRYAFLTLDNVTGNFALTESVPVLYDDFNDRQIDRSKWQVIGTVSEDDALKSALFRNGQPVFGLAATAGIPAGMNIRGFRLNANRSAEPRTIDRANDITAKMELTNGVDFIRISWTMRRNSFTVESGGAYGRYVQEIPVPGDQIPDGPLEVRERRDTIAVLHNGNIKLIIPGTIRAGSFFQLVTDGDPERVGIELPGIQFYDAIIDNLEFYVDRQPSPLRLNPALRRENDTGSSDADHITNRTTLTFDWPGGPAGTSYQWRIGEVRQDGSIVYGAWSLAQRETFVSISAVGSGLGVFSIRPVDAQGIVGEESTRGFVVDLTNPAGPPGLRLSPETDPDGDGVTHNRVLTFVWADAADNHGVAGYRWRINGGAWSPLQTQLSVTLPIALDGIYLFDVRAVDLAGNEGPAVGQGVTIITRPGDSGVIISTSDNGLFVSGLYRDLLGRAADAGGFSAFLGPVDAARLQLLNTVARNFLTSTEYRANLIAGYYQTFLGRTASSAELAFWVGQLQHGLTDATVKAAFLGSDEFFEKHGSTVTTWLTATYHAVLGRAPDTAGQAAWLSQVQAGAPRARVALTLLTSNEFQFGLVAGYYQTYLRRSALPGEVALWLTDIRQGLSSVAVMSAFVSSPEYFRNNGTTNLSWMVGLYADLLHRTPDPAGLESHLAGLLNAYAAQRKAAATNLLMSTEYRFAQVARYYQTFLGRSASPNEVAFWEGQLRRGLTDEQVMAIGKAALLGSVWVGLTDEQVMAAFLGSDEFFQKNRGTDAAWLTAAYRAAFGRAPDAAGQAFWLSQVQAGTPRASVALSLLTSNEYRANLVTRYFRTYLHRPASESEISAWAGHLQQGLTDKQMLAILLSSPEYLSGPNQHP